MMQAGEACIGYNRKNYKHSPKTSQLAQAGQLLLSILHKLAQEDLLAMSPEFFKTRPMMSEHVINVFSQQYRNSVAAYGTLSRDQHEPFP